MPKISVIVPIYNVKDYLVETIISLQRQTFTDFECLLIDDGSTDGSAEVCDEVTEKDLRFKVFHKENGGQNTARNLGLKNASGDYITFVDGDDRLPDYALELMYNAAVENNCDYVAGQRLVVKKSEEVDSDKLKNVKNHTKQRYMIPFSPKDIDSKTLWMKEWFMTAPGNLIKKEIYADLLFNEDLHMAEDQILMKELLWRSKKVIILDEYIYLYVVRETSLTHQRNQYAIDIFESFKIMLSILKKYNLYRRHYLNCFYYYNKWAILHLVKHLEYGYFNVFYDKYRTFIKERDDTLIYSNKIKEYLKKLENPLYFYFLVIIPTHLDYIAYERNACSSLKHLRNHFSRLIYGKITVKLWECIALPCWIFKFCADLLKNRSKND